MFCRTPQRKHLAGLGPPFGNTRGTQALGIRDANISVGGFFFCISTAKTYQGNFAVVVCHL